MRALILICFLCQLSPSFAFGQNASPQAELPKSIAQPIPFSHKKHIDVGLDCDACHKPGSEGETKQIPAAADCMVCHQAIKTESPSIHALARYAKNGTRIPWVRIYTIPDFVVFSHNVHQDAGFKCERCHGPVRTRDVLGKEQDFTMKTCIICHRANNALTGCDVCHKLSM
jgi:hypothetical protein